MPSSSGSRNPSSANRFLPVGTSGSLLARPGSSMVLHLAAELERIQVATFYILPAWALCTGQSLLSTLIFVSFVVYLARQRSPERRVALKLITPAFATDAGFRRRFIREAAAAAAIEDPQRHVMSRQVWAMSLAFAVVLGACHPQKDEDGPARFTGLEPVLSIELLGASYAGLAALPDGYVFSRSLPNESGGALVVHPRNSASERVIRPHSDSRCAFQDFLYPLPVGNRVGVLQLCARRGVGDAHLPDLYSVRTVGVGTKEQVVLLRDEPSPVRLPLGAFDFDQSEGALVGLGDPLCGTIARWSHSGIHPLDVSVTSPDGARFSLSDLFDGIDCRATGIAAWPRWRSGGEIVFLASPDATTSDSTARLRSEWYVFGLAPRDSTARLLSPCPLIGARALTLTDDGRVALVSGEMANYAGTWELKLGTSGIRRVSQLALDWIATSKQRVLGISNASNELDAPSQLVEFARDSRSRPWTSCSGLN